MSVYTTTKQALFGAEDHVQSCAFQAAVNADPEFASFGVPIRAINGAGDSLMFVTDSDLPSGAITAMGVVGSTASLQCAKTTKHEAIDKRTEELIVTSGFAHAAAPGKVFSTSANAQSKWHAIMNLAQLGVMPYPTAINTKDESSYDIADLADLTAMYAAMVGTGKYHHDSGKTLKDAVYAATTVAQVEAVVDPR